MTGMLLDLPLIVIEGIFSYCSGKDLLNIATCSKRLYQNVGDMMWSTMNIQWALLNDLSTIKEKLKFMNRTKTLKIYNGFIADMDTALGVGEDSTAGYRYILSECDSTKLRTLHVRQYLCQGGLLLAGRVLTELDHLSIHNVHLPTEEWSAISCFSKLRTLSFYNCDIDDTIWHHVRQLSDLRTLEIRECDKVNYDLAYLCASNLQVLEEFTFDLFDSSADIEGNAPTLSSLFKHSNLHLLQLRHRKLRDEAFFDIFDGLDDLTVLNLNWSSNNLSDAMLKHVRKLSNLKELYLQANNITDEGVSYISTMKTLNKLVLNCCNRITDLGLSSISKMVSLEELSLGGMRKSKISDEGLNYLSTSNTISKLDFSGSRILSDRGMAYLENLRTQVDVLCFIQCERISDQGVRSLRKLTSLVALHLTECEGITDVAMTDISHLTNLRELYIGSTNITDFGLSCIAVLSLRTLDLSMCQWISDVGLVHVAQMKSLVALNLFGCKEITDVGLLNISKLQSLRRLQLSFCSQITDEGVAHLRNLPAMNWLGVEECYNVSDSFLCNSLCRHKTIVRKLDLLNLAMYYAFDGDDMI